MAKVKAAIIGSGNIGTDLMIKIMRASDVLEMGAMVGIDPASDGLARAQRMGVATTHEGIEGLQKLDVWPEIGVVFDATSAGAHKKHSDVVTGAGKVMIDLTPAAIVEELAWHFEHAAVPVAGLAANRPSPVRKADVVAAYIEKAAGQVIALMPGRGEAQRTRSG